MLPLGTGLLWFLRWGFPGPREDPILLNLRSLGTHCIDGADSGYDNSGSVVRVMAH